MNSYCKHHIERFYQMYIARTFDQDDVALFLVLVRDYSIKNTVFQELGDFLAHPKLKDRGIVINSFLPVVEFFEENIDEVFSNLDIKTPDYNGIGTIEEIINDLSNAFKQAEIKNIKINKDDLSFRDFVFCLVFLLSDFKIKIDGRLFNLQVSYGHSLELNVHYESRHHARDFATLNVLNLGNIWVTNSSGYKTKLENHIARRFDNGCLGALPYSIDTLNLSSDISTLPRDTVWPLVDLK